MRLPATLQQAIDDEAKGVGTTALARAWAQLTERYKAGQYATAPLDSAAARCAYLQVRMPATFAANARVFRELASIASIQSMLDLGAGPGTSMWAAVESIPSIERFTLIERDRELVELGRRLAWHSTNEAVRAAAWDCRDVAALTDTGSHDLVVLSYVLGELPAGVADQMIRAAWSKATKLLVIVEPGTPRNFANILSARDVMLASGAYPVAPCPHGAQCPMADGGDWCHFSERLQRTSEHRRMKAASLGYEDEKFSYFAASRAPLALPKSRIVRHPMKHKGHVQLTLCTDGGLVRQTVAKSQREAYRDVRDAGWGDAWNYTPEVLKPQH